MDTQKTIYDTRLDYSNATLVEPHCKSNIINPINQNNSVALAQNSVTQFDFVIPSNQPFNPHNSVWKWNETYAAQGSTKSVCLFMLGYRSVNSVVMRTQSGIVLGEIQNFDLYSQVAPLYYTKETEVQQNGKEAVITNGTTLFQSPLYADSEDLLKDSGDVFGVPSTVTIDRSGDTGGAWTNDRSLLENLRQAPLNTAVSVRREIKWGDACPGTIFALNHDIIFPEQVIVSVIFNPTNNIAFATTATNGDVAYSSTSTLNAGSVVITNSLIKLCVQTNPLINMALMEKFQSEAGLSFQIPSVVLTKQQLGNSTNSFYSCRVSRSSGRSLLRSFMLLTTGEEQDKSAYLNRYNADDGLVNTFNVSLNNKPLRSYDFTPSQYDPYYEMQPFITGSAVGTRKNHERNWDYCENFHGSVSTKWRELDFVKGGIDLSETGNDLQLQFNCLVKEAFNSTFWAFNIVQGNLLVSSMGVQKL